MAILHRELNGEIATRKERDYTPTDSRPHPRREKATGGSRPEEDNPRRLRDLRSIVARRFMNMLQAHDRVRTELLASHLPQERSVRTRSA
jgi:hypothetical protein